MSNRTLDSDWSYEADQFLLACRDQHPTPSWGEIARRLTAKLGTHRTHAACIGRFDRILKESEEALATAQRHVRRKTLTDRQREVGDPYHPLPEWFRVPTPVETNTARLTALRQAQELAAGGTPQAKACAPRAERMAVLGRKMTTGEFDAKVEARRIRSRDAKRLKREEAAREKTTRSLLRTVKLRPGESPEAAEKRRWVDIERHRRNAETREKALAEAAAKLGVEVAEVRRRAKEHRRPQKAIGLDREVGEARAEQRDEIDVALLPKPLAPRHYRPIWTD